MDPASIPALPADRALDLCEYKIARTTFGLSYTDLMNLPYSEFCEIEARVIRLAEQESKSLAEMQKKNGIDKDYSRDVLKGA